MNERKITDFDCFRQLCYEEREKHQNITEEELIQQINEIWNILNNSERYEYGVKYFDRVKEKHKKS